MQVKITTTHNWSYTTQEIIDSVPFILFFNFFFFIIHWFSAEDKNIFHFYEQQWQPLWLYAIIKLLNSEITGHLIYLKI